MEQFGNHRTYSAEMCRSCLSAKSLGQIVHIHIGAEIIKVHFAVFRMENDICAGLLTKLSIAVKISWITCQILCRSKLDRIDKYADNHAVIFSNRLIDQTFMSFVKVAHRRYKSYTKSLFSPLFYLFSYSVYCCYNFHFSSSNLVR